MWYTASSSLLTWGHRFCLGNIFIALLTALPFIILAPSPATGFGRAYQIISWVGHFSFLSFAIYILTLFPLSILLPRPKVLLPIGVTIATLGQTTLFLDTEIFKIFKFHLNPLILDFLFQFPLEHFPFLFYKVSTFFFFIIFIEIFLAYRIYLKLGKKKRRVTRTRQWVMATILTAFITTHLFHIWADAVGYLPITRQKPNFPLSYPMTAKTFLSKYGWIQTKSYQTQTAELLHTFEAQQFIYPSAPLEVQNTTKPKNILWIVIRNLHPKMLSDETMPHLASYREKNISFEQHYSGSNQPDLALYTLFYGLTPNYWPQVSKKQQPPILIDELIKQDYILGFFATEDLQKPVFRQGITSTIRQQTSHRIQGNLENDAISLHYWKTWYQQLSPSRPWFAYLQLNEDEKKTIPDHLTSPFKEQGEKTAVNNQHQLFYIDSLFSEILNTIGQQQDLENTIVMITSDCSTSLPKEPVTETNQDFRLEKVHVPLIISWPDQRSKKFTAKTSHLDVAPTLLEQALGIRSSPEVYALGQNLFAKSPRSWIVTGNATDYTIFDGNNFTAFNLQGEFKVFDAQNLTLLAEQQPDMVVVMQVIDQLSRFHHPP